LEPFASTEDVVFVRRDDTEDGVGESASGSFVLFGSLGEAFAFVFVTGAFFAGTSAGASLSGELFLASFGSAGASTAFSGAGLSVARGFASTLSGWVVFGFAFGFFRRTTRTFFFPPFSSEEGSSFPRCLMSVVLTFGF